MPFEMIPLPYAYDALEPSIDARTMDIHYNKHYGGYTAKLNSALEHAPELGEMGLVKLLGNLDKVPESIRTAVRNNGGGYANHTMFWEIMGPDAGGEPTGDLAKAISKQFGDFATFKAKFNDAAASVFGSGWTWVTADKDGSVALTTTPNQDTPLMVGKTPIMGLDVWEHGYYLKYQNRRPDYIAAWWDVVNWPKIAENYKSAVG